MEDDAKNNDYAARFLADMEAKYAALGNAIASVRAALNIGALGGLGVVADSASAQPANISPGGAGTPVPLPRGAFLGKTIAEAIKIYLNAVRARKGNKEISQALRDGGAVSTGNLDQRVAGALFGLKQKGEVLRFDDGWGLGEWYPESFRTRISEKPANGGKKKKPKRKAKPISTPESTDSKAKAHTQADIERFFEASPGSDISTSDIAAKLSTRVQTVNLVCAKLAHQGKIDKVSQGIFRSAKVHPIPKVS